MASTTLQCTPLLVGRSCEGGCLGGTAMTPKSNSPSTAVAATFHRTGSRCFEKATRKAVLSGAATGEPQGVLQSISKSSLFGGSIDSSQRRRREVLPGSSWECGKFSRRPRMQAVQAIPGNVEMLEAYEIERKVRDYELDHYGVVNNAIYAQFCQQARTELLENIGFHPDGVTESGKSMAISDMTMKFLSPLRSGDRYIVSSRVAGTTAVRLIFEDHIYRLPERQLVMTARSTVVVLGQNGKPGRLPDEIKIKLVAGYSTNCQVKLTNGDINGNSASTAQVKGNSTSHYVNGNSTSNGSSMNGPLNDYPLNGYVNGNLVNGYINGNSPIDPVTGLLTSDHLHGSNANDNYTTDIHVNGNSKSGHIDGDSTNDRVQGN